MKVKDIPNSKFKHNDLVLYQSASGSNYNTFCYVIGYLNKQKVLVRPVLKYNGSSFLADISSNEEGTMTVPEYSLSLGTDILQRKIELAEKQLENLKFLKNNIK